MSPAKLRSPAVYRNMLAIVGVRWAHSVMVTLMVSFSRQFPQQFSKHIFPLTLAFADRPPSSPSHRRLLPRMHTDGPWATHSQRFEVRLNIDHRRTILIPPMYPWSCSTRSSLSPHRLSVLEWSDVVATSYNSVRTYLCVICI